MAPWITKLIAKLFGNDIIKTVIQAALGTVVVESINYLFRGLRALPAGKAIGELEVLDNDFESLINEQLTRGDITQDEHDTLSSAYNDLNGKATVTKPVSTILFLIQYFRTLTDSTNGGIKQVYDSKFRPSVPQPALVANGLRFKDSENLRIIDILQRNGISDADIDTLAASLRTPLDTASILQLLFNKDISTDTAKALLENVGLISSDIDLLINSAPNAPLTSTIGGLLEGYVVNDSIAEALQLDINRPADLADWLHTNGLPSEWASRFWRAHYQLPPIDMFYQAKNRGMLSGFDAHGYYEAIGIPPALYTVMDELSTVPISMLQANEAQQNGIIGPDTFKAIAGMNGFSSGDAQILLDISQSTLNTNVTTNTIQAVRYAISDGFIRDSTALTMFEGLGFTAQQAQQQVQLSHYQAAYEFANKALAAIQKGFKTGKLDGNAATTEIIALGIQPEKAQQYVSLWTQEAANSQKVPTMTDIQDMLKYKIINESETVKYITLNGYNATDAARLAALFLARK